MKNQKLKQAVEILELHYEEHRAVPKESIEFLITNFPEFVNESIAYRVIILKPLQDPKIEQLSEPFKSWSASLEGIKKFLHNEDVDMVWDMDDRVFIYQAKVEGFRVPKFVKMLRDQGIMNLAQSLKFLEEDEILVSKVEAVQLFQEGLFKEFSL